MAQQCTSCHTASPDGAKFCPECGTAFARSCPSCGTPASGGKFCAECGTPLSAAPSLATIPRQATPTFREPVSERRTTTVLFGDLVSFTTLSESRDPEEVRELLSEYFAVARKVIERYGGTIEKFIGDAVMAVWGVPVAHEDDAERAVRAGLDLVAEVAALGASVGIDGLAMRVGVVTGSVAVTLGAINEGMVAGDAVNTAARVQGAAAPGTVWTDGETRSLTAVAIAFTDMGEHELKGKAEPVQLFRADAVVAGNAGAQRVDGLEAPITGRDAELRTLKECFHAVESDGRSRMVLVEGEAGTGKTRLGWEFFKYVDGLSRVFAWHRGRCLSYGEGVAFWAFAEMMRSRLRVLEGDDQAQVEAKVHEGVQEHARDEAEAAWLAPRIIALLGSAAGHQSFDRMDLFAAWSTFLERVGGDAPTVLLFEDTQHADSGLLDLVDYLMSSCGAHLFIVLCARPELRVRRPSVASGQATTVRLDPLSEAAMAQLVDGLVAGLPPRARAAIVAKSSGVPLYAVETVRSLIDRDAVIPRDGRYTFVDHDGMKVDLDQLAAPTSLHTLIAARLDALTPVERRVCQAASVLGMSFAQVGVVRLSEILPGEVDVALMGLVRKGVIEPQLDPRSPELGQYRFLQALVREVAYSTLSRKDRKARHLAAAEHLAEEEIAEAVAGVIAQHLVDALDASGSADPDRAQIADRARRLLVAAAERAESLGSPDEALRCTLSAMRLEPDEAEWRALSERGARVAVLAGDAPQALELAEPVRVAYEAAGDRDGAARVGAWMARAHGIQGRHHDALAIARPLWDEFEHDPNADPAVLIGVQRVLAQGYRALGDAQNKNDIALRLLAMSERLGDPAAIVDGMVGVAISLFDLGSETAFVALLERCIEISREHHLVHQLARSLTNLVPSYYPVDLPRAQELAAEAVAASTRAGDALFVDLALANSGWTWWLAGQWPQLRSVLGERLGQSGTSFARSFRLALSLAAAATDLDFPDCDYEDVDDVFERAGMALSIALRQAAEGDPVPAAEQSAAAFRAAYLDADSTEDVEIMWTPTVELQLAAGRVDEAAALLDVPAISNGSRRTPLTLAQRARLTGLVQAARGEDADAALRDAERRFAEYGAPFYLARTRLELGRWLCENGQAAEGLQLLAAARPTFEQLGAQPSLAELAELAERQGQVPVLA